MSDKLRSLTDLIGRGVLDEGYPELELTAPTTLDYRPRHEQDESWLDEEEETA